MKTLSVKLPATGPREYPIHIGTGLIEKTSELFDVNRYSKLFVITDETVESLFLEKLLHAIPSKVNHITLPTGEEAKDITHLTNIWKAMIQKQLDRKSLVINLGGGVIGDIGGFAASTYMRGIDFINIPTTLLAQVDESVGGKTMIDFHGIKNVVGTFYQPSAVVIDVQTLKTLPKKQLLSGFAEIIKTGLIKDETFYRFVTSKMPSDFSESELIEIITRSCDIKSEIVQSDEKESGKRKLLNYGHTFGHAVEAVSLETENPLLHGEAISIGMVLENEIAIHAGMLSKEIAEKVKKSLQSAGLPTDIPGLNTRDIMQKMNLDKKNAGGKIRFTLLKQIGEAVFDQTVSEDIVKRILHSV